MSDLRTELLKIREKRGILTPTVVLEEATDENHPLHSKFTWDDGEAARRWRLSEAASLLRVTFRADLGGRPADLRAFWVKKGTEDDPRSQYVPIEEIAANPISEKILLQQMRRDWQRFRNRYETHDLFFQMIREDLPDDLPVTPEDEDEDANGTEGR